MCIRDRHPGEACPNVLVAIEEDGYARVAFDVPQASEVAGRLWLFVDRDNDATGGEGVTDRDEMWNAVRTDGAEASDAKLVEKVDLPRCKWRRIHETNGSGLQMDSRRAGRITCAACFVEWDE